MTPPSCFSSASIQLETSPIENLLIEHPSMSVYHNIRRRSMNGINTNEIEDLVILELSQGNDNDDVVSVFFPLFYFSKEFCLRSFIDATLFLRFESLDNNTSHIFI